MATNKAPIGATQSTQDSRKSTARKLATRARWTAADDKTIKKLIKENTPTRIMALKLERTESAIRQRAQRKGLLLKPTNRSPYGKCSSENRG